MLLFFRCLAADFQKTKRTSFIWLHLSVPVICAGVFLLYFYNRQPDPYQLYRTYFEAIAIALPLLIGIVCGMTASLEEQAGRFQVLLGGTAPKLTAYLSKVTLLLIMNIFCGILGYWTLLIGAQSSFSCAEPAKLPFFRGWGMAGSRKCHTLFHILFDQLYIRNGGFDFSRRGRPFDDSADEHGIGRCHLEI